MHVDEGLANSARIALTERFQQIQGARPTLTAPAKDSGNAQKGGNNNNAKANGKTLGNRRNAQPRRNARSRRYNR